MLGSGFCGNIGGNECNFGYSVCISMYLRITHVGGPFACSLGCKSLGKLLAFSFGMLTYSTSSVDQVCLSSLSSICNLIFCSILSALVLEHALTSW